MMEQKYISLRDYVGKALNAAKEEFPNITVIDSDLDTSTRAHDFAVEHPDSFVELGIAESSAVSLAMGMAQEGMIPFYVNFAIFVTGTSWTQLRQACYENANVKILGTHPGMDDGPDGASHHANEDLAITRVIPNMTVLVPCNEKEVMQAVKLACEIDGPVYIRVARDLVPERESKKIFVSGEAEIVKSDGYDVALVYEGTAAKQAHEVFDGLSNAGRKVTLVNIRSLKPMDKTLIKEMAKKTERFVTIENHTVIGGLGGAIAEELSSFSNPVKLMRFGVQDEFTESGKTADVKKKYGLDSEKIVVSILDEF
jgi:transketolase